MSRIPESCPKISEKFKRRVIEIIVDEDYRENGEPCNSAEFAARTGVNKNAISNIVNYGIIPSVRLLMKIADYKNISLDYLLCKTDDDYFVKSENPSTFKERFLELKNEKNLTNADINRKTTFTRNSIQVWLKRNNIPTLEYLYQLAKVFDVSVDYLLGRTDYRK